MDFIKLILCLIKAIRKNIMLFFIITLAGFLGSLIIVVIQKPIYSSRAIILTDFRNTYLPDLIRNIVYYRENGKAETISSEMNISIEAFNSIKSIDVTENPDPKEERLISLTVGFYNKEFTDTFFKGLQFYLENNLYLRKRNELLQQQTSELIDLINTKESLLNTGIFVNDLVQVSPITQIEQIISLRNRKNEFLRSKERLSQIIHYVEIIPSINPEKPTLYTVALTTFASIIIALMIIIMIELNNYYKKDFSLGNNINTI